MSDVQQVVAQPRPTPAPDAPDLVAELNAMLVDRLPGTLGICVLSASGSEVTGELAVTESVLAPNGYLHAATVAALADTLCGIGTRLSLPAGAAGFTTSEIKVNYLGTARSGVVHAVARCRHAGRRTQIWDAELSDDTGRLMALFRCSQLVLFDTTAPRADPSRSTKEK